MSTGWSTTLVVVCARMLEAYLDFVPAGSISALCATDGSWDPSRPARAADRRLRRDS